jgi:hypothetical protein
MEVLKKIIKISGWSVSWPSFDPEGPHPRSHKRGSSDMAVFKADMKIMCFLLLDCSIL